MTSTNQWGNRRRVTAAVMTISICAAALIGSPASSSATSGASASGCKPAGSTTLANDGKARIYSVPTPLAGRPEARSLEFVRIFGCLFATGRPVLLGSTEPTGKPPQTPTSGSLDLKAISLQAPWVGYASTYSGTDFNQVRVVVRNLRTGKVKLFRQAGPPLDEPETFSAVTDLAVGGSGSLAWIGRSSSIGGASAREVASVDSSGAFTVLDEAANIDLHSLALQGQRLSWTDGGAAHSAQLP